MRMAFYKSLIFGVAIAVAVVCSSLVCHAADHCLANFKENDVVYIGDSISLPDWGYSDAFVKEIEQKKSKVARYAVGGSAASSWQNHFAGARMFTQAYDAKNPQVKLSNHTLCENRSGRLKPSVPGANFPTLDSLLNKTSRAIVIELGTNDIGNYCKAISIHAGKAEAGTWVFKESHDLAVRAHNSNSRCFWLEPIHYKSGLYFDYCTDQGKHPDGYEKALQALKDSIGSSCTLIGSSDCPVPTQFDKIGLHPKVGGRELGQCLGKKVKQALDAPNAQESGAVKRAADSSQ